jgi:hypothetical protein
MIKIMGQGGGGVKPGICSCFNVQKKSKLNMGRNVSHINIEKLYFLQNMFFYPEYCGAICKNSL